jgi:hypothetical protein
MIDARAAVQIASTQTPHYAAYSISRELENASHAHAHGLIPLEPIREILEALLESREDEKDEKIAALEEEVADAAKETKDADEKIDDLTAEVAKLEDDNADLVSERDDATEKLAECQKELAKSQAAFPLGDATEYAALTEALRVLNAVHTEPRVELTRAHAALALVQAETAARETERTGTLALLEAMRAELEAAHGTLRALSAGLRTLTASQDTEPAVVTLPKTASVVFMSPEPAILPVPPDGMTYSPEILARHAPAHVVVTTPAIFTVRASAEHAELVEAAATPGAILTERAQADLARYNGAVVEPRRYPFTPTQRAALAALARSGDGADGEPLTRAMRARLTAHGYIESPHGFAQLTNAGRAALAVPPPAPRRKRGADLEDQLDRAVNEGFAEDARTKEDPR